MQTLPSILALIPSPQSFEMLETLLFSKDARMRSSAVRAMQKFLSYTNIEITPDFSRLQNVLHSELQLYFQMLVYIITVEKGGKGGELLVSALWDRAKETLDRAFMLLGMIYPKQQIEIVSYNMRSENPAMRANASEIVDNICDGETKRYLLPILDAIDIQEKAALGLSHFQLNQYELSDLLHIFLLDDSDEWLATCAIKMIGEQGLKILYREVGSYATHEVPVMRETVLYSLSRMMPETEFAKIAELYKGEKEPDILAYLGSLYQGKYCPA